MKRFLSVVLVLMLTLTLLLTGCRGQKKVQSIEPENLKREYELNETPDFSDVTATITYNDGTKKSVNSGELTFSELNTSVVGKKVLEITYEGFTASFDVYVKAPSTDLGARSVESIEYLSGLPAAIYKNDVLNFDAIKIVVNYVDAKGEKTEETQTVATNASIKHNGHEIDTSKPGNYTLTLSFAGKSVSVNVVVNDLVITGLQISGNVDTTIYENQDFDPTGMEVYALYNNGARLIVPLSNLTITRNGNVVTVSYQGKSADITLSYDTPYATSMNIVATGYEDKENTIILGDAFSFSGIKAEVSLSNGLVSSVDHSDLTFDIDVSKEGDATLTVTYAKDTSIKATQTIKVLGVSKIAIDTASVSRMVKLNDTFAYSNLSLIVTCSDGKKYERGIDDGIKYDVSAVDTTEKGTYLITASFGDHNTTLAIIVYEEANYVITNVELPEALTAEGLAARKSLFKNQNYGYVVGDDNPFIFKLVIKAEDEFGTPLDYSPDYTGYSEVYLDGTKLADENLLKYVFIDDANNTFDFTEDAIGKTFTIKTRPLFVAAGREESMTREITVTVVDGLNIHEAWELNYLTNVDGSESFDFPQDDRTQLEIVEAFLKSKDENATPKTNLAGVVIHNNLIIERTDIPAEYFVNSNRNDELWDVLTIFHHVNDSPTKEFNFYGNYFTIYSYNLPNVCALENTNGNQTDGISNGQLFRFLAYTGGAGGNYDHTQYTTNINSVYMRDDNPNTDNEMTAGRDMRGLIGMKVLLQNVNLENVRMEAFYISFFIDSDFTTANLNECKFYNSWQNHIFIWSSNTLQDDDEYPRENYPVATLNATNSSITKCGGPVIISQTAHAGKNKTDKSGANVNLDENCEIWTYVTGQEAWFSAMAATPTATKIQQLGYILKQSLGTSYITTIGEDGMASGGTVYMNIVMIQLQVADTVDEMVAGSADLDSSFTFAGTTHMDMTDKYTATHVAGGTVGYGNQNVAKLIGMYGGQAPVFTNALGGVAVFDGTSLQTALTGDATMDEMNKQALSTGDYIALHMGNMGIVLGYGYTE